MGVKLTVRQKEVLSCLLKGWSNLKIAKHLKVEERTVQSHLRSIYIKLNVSSRSEAVTKILKKDILIEEDKPLIEPGYYKDTANVFDIILLNILTCKLKSNIKDKTLEYHLAETAFIARNNCSLKFITSLSLEYINELNYMCGLIKYG